MCGRYMMNMAANPELAAYVREAAKRPGGQKLASPFDGGEVRPTDPSVILKMAGCHPYAAVGFWGFSFQGKQILLARLETILEKPMFSESMLYRRCVVPASGFFEWTRGTKKKKYYFDKEDGACLYMAGIWMPGEDGDRFVIVTTDADTCTQPVHDRMPVVLDREEADEWLGDWQRAWTVAHRVSPQLKKQCCEAYEQLTLF